MHKGSKDFNDIFGAFGDGFTEITKCEVNDSLLLDDSERQGVTSSRCEAVWRKWIQTYAPRAIADVLHNIFAERSICGVTSGIVKVSRGCEDAFRCGFCEALEETIKNSREISSKLEELSGNFKDKNFWSQLEDLGCTHVNRSLRRPTGRSNTC